MDKKTALLENSWQNFNVKFDAKMVKGSFGFFFFLMRGGNFYFKCFRVKKKTLKTIVCCFIFPSSLSQQHRRNNHFSEIVLISFIELTFKLDWQTLQQLVVTEKELDLSTSSPEQWFSYLTVCQHQLGQVQIPQCFALIGCKAA